MYTTDLEITYNGIEYTVKDVDYDTPDKGDYWTPGSPGGINGYGKVFSSLVNVHDKKELVDITELLDSIIDQDDFEDTLWEALTSKWDDALEDAAEAAWEAKRDEGL